MQCKSYITPNGTFVPRCASNSFQGCVCITPVYRVGSGSEIDIAGVGVFGYSQRDGEEIGLQVRLRGSCTFSRKEFEVGSPLRFVDVRTLKSGSAHFLNDPTMYKFPQSVSIIFA